MSKKPPFVKSVSVADLPAEGRDIEIVADVAEREALARAFDLPAVHGVAGRYHLQPLSGGRVLVEGTVEADIRQTCVITLEPVDTRVSEPVDVIFAQRGPTSPADRTLTHPEQETIDPPDEIVGGSIDLGALTAEFLALGIDPYPRKPGAEFTQEHGAAGNGRESLFSALSERRKGGKG